MTENDKALKALECMYNALKNRMKSEVDIAPNDKHVIAAIMEMELKYRTVQESLMRSVPQWLPIETAPNGKRILCYNAKTRALFVRGGAMVGTPTHWMPILPPPTEEK